MRSIAHVIPELLARSDLQTEPLSAAAFLTRLIGGVVLLNLFVFAMLGLSLQHSYLQYQERAEVTTQNLTQTLENDIAGAIKTDDLALHSVIDEYRRQSAAGAVDSALLNAYIERLHSRLPEVDSLGIANAQGMLVYGSDVLPGARTSVADRAYFLQLRVNLQAGLVISKPLLGRITQKWAIVLARRIDQPDGSFGGIALSTIALEYLFQKFSALNVGRNGVIVLRDADLGVIVRYPELGAPGTTTGSQEIARELKELIAAQRSSGTIAVRSSLDHVERAYSYRKVGPYPLYILVGLATEDYLSVWRDNATEQAAFVALFTLITLLSTWLIYRTWHRHADLVEEKEKYWRFFQLSTDLMCIADPFGCFTQVNPAFIKVTGYSESELVAKPFLDFVIPEDRQGTADEMRLQVSIRPSLSFENRYLRKEGTVVFLSWTAYFDKSDGVTLTPLREM